MSAAEWAARCDERLAHDLAQARLMLRGSSELPSWLVAQPTPLWARDSRQVSR